MSIHPMTKVMGVLDIINKFNLAQETRDFSRGLLTSISFPLTQLICVYTLYTVCRIMSMPNRGKNKKKKHGVRFVRHDKEK